ncbi:splA [Symbiodinium sp. CCMP2592]|nr:splA [Symbiodinium sp. CCMP2592]
MALGKWSLEVLQNSRALFQRRRNREPPEPTEPSERDAPHWHCCQVSKYCRRRACALLGFIIVALRIQYLHGRAALLSRRAVITCADMTSLRSALETANSSNWPRFMQDADNATEERCRDLGPDQELEEPLGAGAGSLVDHFSTEMNKLLPPQYRFDIITLVLVTVAFLYLVQTSDERPTPRARRSHSFALSTLTESLALSAVAETQESKAVKRLQAAYFDLVCRMRPDRSGNFQVGALPHQPALPEHAEHLEVKAAKPVRLLFLHASPLCVLTRGPNGQSKYAPLPRLKIDREVHAVREALQGAIDVKVKTASIHNLRKAVTEGNLWLHLSAHTANESTLVLEDGFGGTEALTLHALVRLLRSGGTDAPAAFFVFLSNCRSDTLAAAFYSAGVQHIVYTNRAVTDHCASRFAKSFYLAMACRRSLRNAFRIALSEVEADLEGGDSGFRLFSNGDVLLQVPEVAHPDLSPKAYENLPGPVEDFVGREEIMLSVLQHLAHRRVVVLHCPRRLGLTATLTMIARYISAPGRKFSGSCIFGEAQPLKKGLLIIDDADSALLEHAEVLKQNLESDKFYLLAGCSKPQWELFSDVVKAVHVELPPLSLLESATLFLQRCHRPLTLEDVLHPNSTDERVVKKEPLPKERAKQLLKPMASVFEGDPRLIRQAAGKVTPNRPPLHGDLESLKAECIGALEAKKTPCLWS